MEEKGRESGRPLVQPDPKRGNHLLCAEKGPARGAEHRKGKEESSRGTLNKTRQNVRPRGRSPQGGVSKAVLIGWYSSAPASQECLNTGTGKGRARKGIPRGTWLSVSEKVTRRAEKSPSRKKKSVIRWS